MSSLKKRCSKCGEAKPLADFYRSPGMRDGHRNDCKACNLAAKAERYRKDPEAAIERTKKWQRENRERYNARLREWRSENKDKIREGHLKRKFGITQCDYEAMLEAQGGGCGICGNLPKEGVALHVDHDHVTGEVRGLLCVSCNNGLGQFRETPALLHMAGEYLEAGTALLVEVVDLTDLARERATSLCGGVT